MTDGIRSGFEYGYSPGSGTEAPVIGLKSKNAFGMKLPVVLQLYAEIFEPEKFKMIIIHGMHLKERLKLSASKAERRDIEVQIIILNNLFNVLNVSKYFFDYIRAYSLQFFCLNNKIGEREVLVLAALSGIESRSKEWFSDECYLREYDKHRTDHVWEKKSFTWEPQDGKLTGTQLLKLLQERGCLPKNRSCYTNYILKLKKLKMIEIEKRPKKTRPLQIVKLNPDYLESNFGLDIGLLRILGGTTLERLRDKQQQKRQLQEESNPYAKEKRKINAFPANLIVAYGADYERHPAVDALKLKSVIEKFIQEN